MTFEFRIYIIDQLNTGTAVPCLIIVAYRIYCGASPRSNEIFMPAKSYFMGSALQRRHRFITVNIWDIERNAN